MTASGPPDFVSGHVRPCVRPSSRYLPTTSAVPEATQLDEDRKSEEGNATASPLLPSKLYFVPIVPGMVHDTPNALFT
jgi:hypothetical protein